MAQDRVPPGRRRFPHTPKAVESQIDIALAEAEAELPALKRAQRRANRLATDTSRREKQGRLAALVGQIPALVRHAKFTGETSFPVYRVPDSELLLPPSEEAADREYLTGYAAEVYDFLVAANQSPTVRTTTGTNGDVLIDIMLNLP
jgi:hypothetical protein